MRPLYVEGRIPEGGVAIVGSRTPPPEAAFFAYDLAACIGLPVIAGLALGIDTAAHRGAIAAGMPTAAFVGHGAGATYPPENAELERTIVASGGAVATLQRAGESVTEEALVQRDRLQAQYARAVVLVCSELEGGAMHTMQFAGELGRTRFAVVPPQVGSAWSGNVRALADGAIALPLNADEAAKTIRGYVI